MALIPADELSSVQETAHLLSSPANAARLLSALVRSRKRTTPAVELETLMSKLDLSAPLEHLGPDIWSRRITARDRLVYRVGDDFVDFLQARYHY